jgi:hypothetical protein
MCPSITDLKRSEYTTDKGKLQFYSVVTVDYYLFCVADGSELRLRYSGEAADTGDKSISKALTMAFKSFCFHVFQIPLNGNDDNDKHVADETSAPPEIPEDIKTLLRDAAGSGLDELKAAWKAVAPETRELITKHHAKFWQDLKSGAQP